MASDLISKPDLVLIPGAWHTAECYYLIVPLLESAGYQVETVNLISVGAEPAVKSLDPDVQHIRNVLLPMIEKGKEVVVVMHSFGGVPGSAALKGMSKTTRLAEGLPGGIVALVYLCSWVIPEGQSVRSCGGGQHGPEVLKIDGEYIHFLDPIPAIYHDCPEKVQKQAVNHLRHHCIATFAAPLTYAAYQHIPSTYLLCSNDRFISIERQRDLIRKSNANFQTFETGSGHSPFLSQPELTARVIRRAAGEKIEI